MKEFFVFLFCFNVFIISLGFTFFILKYVYWKLFCNVPEEVADGLPEEKKRYK